MTWFALVGHLTHFAGQVLWRLPAGLLVVSAWVRQLYIVLLGAVPLGLVAGLTLGVVTWMHTRDVLTRTGGPGAEQYLPRFLTLAVVLELAPIGAGLLLAARTGASLGAELGAMQLSEQVDALAVLGRSPLHELVAPRVWACILAAPLLTVFISTTAIVGSYAAEAGAGTMSWTLYNQRCWAGLRLEEVIPANLKPLVFGGLVGLAGCFFGLRAEGGTEGVGRAATRSVVTATLLVLVADVLLVGLIRVALGR